MKKNFIVILALVLCLNLPELSFGQADKGLGVKFGVVDPQNLGATVGFGALVELGRISPKLNLTIDFEYWAKSQKSEVNLNFIGLPSTNAFEASFRDLAIGGTLKYIFPTRTSKISPFAGGGLGLHILRTKTKTPGFGIPGFEDPDFEFPASEQSHSNTKIGLRFAGGLSFKLGARTDGFGEVRYWLVDDFNTAAVLAGIVFKLK